MRLDCFDYELPPELIAQHPVEPRDHSRLLVVHRQNRGFEDRRFDEIVDLLKPGDCLVVNDTRVVRARLAGVRVRTGGAWEGLFVRDRGEHWEFMTRTRGKPRPGEWIRLAASEHRLRLRAKTSDGAWLVDPIPGVSVWEFLDQCGRVPLPGYIRDGVEASDDAASYQTVFAENPGAVAAPTAGLHFTRELLHRLKDRGVDVARVTLHVGPGTFRPVKVDDIDQHRMQAEWCSIAAEAASKLERARAAGGRIVAVGTTSVRTLESMWAAFGGYHAFEGDTELFIRPPHQCRSFDALVTNFHLPKSTLLMLVSAVAGRELILEAYRHAVSQRYRFYSYGDAMLIV